MEVAMIDVKELPDEELIFKMGQWKTMDKNEDDIQALIDEALQRTLILPDDSKANGFRVLDMDGVNTMPKNAKDLVFESKGIAWCYWMGLGRPHGERMYAISDPLAEEQALANGEHVEMENISIVRECSAESKPKARHLSVVRS
jgi:hypothetical protein